MTVNARKPANLTIDQNLLTEARALKLNVSRAAEAGIAEAVRQEKSRRWQEENAEAIRSSNEWVERNGLPLAKHRPF
ncbi:type II toxin-antitoxin system CcdA family antitoxin [Devosia albogilva]|uniref:Type II toxin-antitoxin system CcdA family antitoxin n=1 Tax=Devosia albogilva TaxID=429726 RepID=A0ABW5QNJ2_9HYPH